LPISKAGCQGLGRSPNLRASDCDATKWKSESDIGFHSTDGSIGTAIYMRTGMTVSVSISPSNSSFGWTKNFSLLDKLDELLALCSSLGRVELRMFIDCLIRIIQFPRELSLIEHS